MPETASRSTYIATLCFNGSAKPTGRKGGDFENKLGTASCTKCQSLT